jgi:hypothetical protein
MKILRVVDIFPMAKLKKRIIRGLQRLQGGASLPTIESGTIVHRFHLRLRDAACAVDPLGASPSVERLADAVLVAEAAELIVNAGGSRLASTATTVPGESGRWKCWVGLARRCEAFSYNTYAGSL